MGPYRSNQNTSLADQQGQPAFDTTPLGRRAIQQRRPAAGPAPPQQASFYGDTSVGTPAHEPVGPGTITPWQQSQYTSGKMGPEGLSAAIGQPSQWNAGNLLGHSAMPSWDLNVNQPVAKETERLRGSFAKARQTAGLPPHPMEAKIGIQGGIANRTPGVEMPPDPDRAGAAMAVQATPRVDAIRAAAPAQLPEDLRKPMDPHLTGANVSPFRARQLVQNRIGVRGGMGMGQPGIAPPAPGVPGDMRAQAVAEALRQFGPGNAAGIDREFDTHDQEMKMRDALIAKTKGEAAFGPLDRAMADLAAGGMGGPEVIAMMKRFIQFNHGQPSPDIANPSPAGQAPGQSQAAPQAAQGPIPQEHQDFMATLFGGGGNSLADAHRSLLASGLPGANDPNSALAGAFRDHARQSYGPGLADQLQPRWNPPQAYRNQAGWEKGVGRFLTGQWAQDPVEAYDQQEAARNFFNNKQGVPPQHGLATNHSSTYGNILSSIGGLFGAPKFDPSMAINPQQKSSGINPALLNINPAQRRNPSPNSLTF